MAKMEWRGFKRKYFAWDSIIFQKVFPIANFDEAELLTLLADIRKVVEMSSCHNILIAADMNADFARKTKFTDIVEESLNELGLLILWQNPDDNPQHTIENIDYTYMCDRNNAAVLFMILWQKQE